MFPRVGHQGEQGSGCVAWERSGLGLLELIPVPFPSLGIPCRAGLFLGADAALKNSLLKKLYPCKCLLIRVSSSMLVQPQLQGLSKPRAPTPHSIWKQDLFLAGEEMLSWPESIL